MNYTYLESATTTTKKQPTNKQTNQKEQNRTDLQDKDPTLTTHTFPLQTHTHTRMHRRRNQKGLIIN